MTFEVKHTNNPAIIKIEISKFLVRGSYEYTQESDKSNSPLMQELFEEYPFIRTAFVSANFIALESPTVDWKEYDKKVAKHIEEYILAEKPLVIEPEQFRKVPVTVYAESTPNPMAMKFVANKKLVSQVYEFKNVEEAETSPLAKALFNFPYVKEVFLDNNYVSIMRQKRIMWDEIIMELREFIRQYVMNGNPIVIEQELPKPPLPKDIMSMKIVSILDKFVKPAVASDGGNIQFVSYDKEENKVKVQLQGACSGCPSSNRTLKNGIEGILRKLLKDETVVVEAIN
ncbi:MAG: NifU N-terminal domain-containing protein [Capnocytophaga sp.]|nr:NifU N-terminal domain-containing protein [Capnocytophaga sp.]